MGEELKRIMQFFAKLPGLGPRSGQRTVLHMMKNKDRLLLPMIDCLQKLVESVSFCYICGHLDEINPCSICTNDKRDHKMLCIVEDVTDVWAFERSGFYKGGYHVLGGLLSAIVNMTPDNLKIKKMQERADRCNEVIIALNATIEGQTTTHYIMELLNATNAKVSTLAHGIPFGGELDHLDDGTLETAFTERKESR